jgi:tetrapyrrole methylase family protein/MazG family protein
LEDSRITSKTSSPKQNPFDALIKLIESLRGENGCPWDKRQTPQNIAIYLIEEIYELVDAITSNRPDEICEELGDVLFHIFFLARIYQEIGHFDIVNVVQRNTEKMIRRHPHVFGSEKIDNAETVKERWHQIKLKEKKTVNNASVLDTIPTQLPALIRAFRISERAAKIGFDWPDISGVKRKVEEEWSELKSALKKNNKSQVTEEFGDLLFTLVNVARFAQIHPETALSEAVKKFEQRFRTMEKQLIHRGQTLESLSLKEMDEIWDEIKNNEKR